MVRWGKLRCGTATKIKKSQVCQRCSFLVMTKKMLSWERERRGKGKIDSKLGTTNNDKYNEVLRPNAVFRYDDQRFC